MRNHSYDTLARAVGAREPDPRGRLEGQGEEPAFKPHGNARLTLVEVLRIREQRGRRSQRATARSFGVGCTTIRDIWDGKTWKKV